MEYISYPYNKYERINKTHILEVKMEQTDEDKKLYKVIMIMTNNHTREFHFNSKEDAEDFIDYNFKIS